MSLWETIGADIESATGRHAGLRQQESVGGGCINQALRMEYGDSSYLVKLSSAGQVEMFAAEALGLQELQQCSELRVPEPLCWGNDGQASWLVMEYLDLGGRGDAAALAAGLASMHRITRSQFGWVRDNTIGSTPQINTPADDWIEFYNNTDSTIQLAGYALSDDSNEPTQWSFPDTSIAPGEYLIVWADEDGNQEGLHANFKLSADGEVILLSDASLNLIDEIFQPR